MKEELLHLIWSKQLFNHTKLISSVKEPIEILDRGFHNKNDGPDFLEAKIKVGRTILAGSVEIHIKTSDWLKHKHHLNDKYKNVILHVVWVNDQNISSHQFPTLVLNERVPRYYIDNYKKIMENSLSLPCAHAIQDVDGNWLDGYSRKILLERFKIKRKWVKNEFTSIKLDKIYEVLMVVLGMPQNKYGYKQLTKKIPYVLIRKYRFDKHKLEALLFGVSGFLDNSDSTEVYVVQLKKTFKYLEVLHNLIPMSRSDWVLLRVRPNAFPTVRMALLADLFNKISTLEDFILYTPHDKIIEIIENLKVSEYWKYHYVFDKKSKKSEKSIGESTLHKLWINAILPLRMLYTDEIEKTIEGAFQFLRSLPKENNTILLLMQKNGFSNSSAFDSQFNLHLYKYYCIPRKCLNCGIGYQIIRKHD